MLVMMPFYCKKKKNLTHVYTHMRNVRNERYAFGFQYVQRNSPILYQHKNGTVLHYAGAYTDLNTSRREKTLRTLCNSGNLGLY